jgi:hypothetical protein
MNLSERRIAMNAKVTLLITAATIGAIVGVVISSGISDSEAQPDGGKQFQLVLTGKSQVGRENVARYEDIEYGVVCYTAGLSMSCVKK